MTSLIFENVSLQYPIYNAQSMSLRSKIVQLGTGGKVSKRASGVITVQALDDVSFELKDGDAVGITGHNGAGKTTLLRAMAGIYNPISGNICRSGRVTTIIEIGAGLDDELSGYENIYRMGMLLGANYSEMDSRIESIGEFTELGAFLELPVHTYSSGMKMRLMFAVSTSVKPEILLIDEMFGTGDVAFQLRAQKRMEEMISEAKIFVFASHSEELIKRFCNRRFVLSHGKLVEAIL
ncbi:ABC transporter ATP-binding protein [Neorhizobium sp. T786]|uniref:ABC transporter ATP-binding protein n=1 Tax=Pseudorhizobium xiangyangii TaxID=2883104 RepID=UPI001CFF7F59|nr:ABC transporter ATP-binding protein [Neorhizobium xiangyangii]MCB5202606.1 ABC transporter ATP-binding protein [Neorhizobium xiangyangii]